MNTQLTPRAVVAVDELKRAWHAIQNGQFRTDAPKEASTFAAKPDSHRSGTEGAILWEPHERVLPVIGCLGGAGATTTALAIAATTSGASRLVECATATASGLPAATDAELGITSDGWVQGSRDRVLIERGAAAMDSVAKVPPPASPSRPVELTVLDIGWEIGHVLATDSWVRDHVLLAPWLVVVTTATIPGMRRLEGVLSILDGAQTVAAVRGPSRKKWHRDVGPTMGALTRSLDRAGRLVELPEDPNLAVRGLNPHHLLHPRLLATGAQLLRLTESTTVTKGQRPR